ncbi:MAG: hypothetical protein ACKVZJ_10435 [Phycisphaerales bacterium]
MDMLMQLWLPIVLSALLLFFASSVIWMALPIHKNDYTDPKEKQHALHEAVKASGLAPGQYFIPFDNQGKDKSPEIAARMETGPYFLVQIMPGKPNMGMILGLWLINLLIITFFVAYVAAYALPAGAEYLSVFRVVGAAALLAHAGNAFTQIIWQAHPLHTLPGKLFDGVVYALLTAGTFAWLWPSGTVAVP